MLHKDLRTHFNIYGFVRFADEIVDAAIMIRLLLTIQKETMMPLTGYQFKSGPE
jgi:hypothetical protein